MSDRFGERKVSLNEAPRSLDYAVWASISNVICACSKKGKPYKTLIGRSSVSPNAPILTLRDQEMETFTQIVADHPATTPEQACNMKIPSCVLHLQHAGQPPSDAGATHILPFVSCKSLCLFCFSNQRLAPIHWRSDWPCNYGNRTHALRRIISEDLPIKEDVAPWLGNLHTGKTFFPYFVLLYGLRMTKHHRTSLLLGSS